MNCSTILASTDLEENSSRPEMQCPGIRIWGQAEISKTFCAPWNTRHEDSPLSRQAGRSRHHPWQSDARHRYTRGVEIHSGVVFADEVLSAHTVKDAVGQIQQRFAKNLSMSVFLQREILSGKKEIGIRYIILKGILCRIFG